MNANHKQAAPATGPFHPVEHALLSDYLALSRPEYAKDIDLYAEEELEKEDSDQGVVRIRRNSCGDFSRFALENAIARLVLDSVQQRLPQSRVIDSNGNIQLGRRVVERRKQGISLLPQYLFEINWADSGPGYSWPESYYAAFVTEYEQYIVTASMDCPDAYGYEDVAIGHFGNNINLEDGCQTTINNWWEECTDSDPERRWEAFWDAGLIKGNTAREWAISIRGPFDDDFSDAYRVLNQYLQSGKKSREELITYATANDCLWALKQYLDYHG